MTDCHADKHPRIVPGNITSPGSLADIITGNFEQQPDAQEALAELLDAGFSTDQLTMFFVEPAADHDAPAAGARPPPVDQASKGATTGAAVGGAIGVAAAVVAVPLLGPAALAIAGVGAY